MVGDEHNITDTDDVLQKGSIKLDRLRRLLLDSLLEDDLHAPAHLPSHSTVSGVLSIDGAMEVAGDRDWQIVEERVNERG
jgi:hypothetical protein